MEGTLLGKPLPGTWIWTTRPGAEGDLVAEFEAHLGAGSSQSVGPALVRSNGAPTRRHGGIELTFGRTGFRLLRTLELEAGKASPSELDEAVRALRDAVGHVSTFALDAWVPDHDATNPLTHRLAHLEASFLERLEQQVPVLAAKRVALAELAERGGMLVHLCLAGERVAYLGLVRSSDCATFAPGGRARMHVAGERPSRAARKVEEALNWLGTGPGPEELCVDLGAAPGGWSWRLLLRGARVIAVDPARLSPQLLAERRLRHAQQSAFDFTPDEPVDWLFCDMAWRPLEAAQLLAKWGRRRWARLLVANIKLPMKRKVDMVHEVRTLLATAGWKDLRTRQLYHDRDEITLVGHL